ncbi:MAG TPA: hypothetical protein VFA11_19815 [Acidimicrobiales bacterium]|nr:hypothetical protein [Acidimicrobiales bacterium]
MTETAVIFGGPSPEHDVSVLTGLQCARALVDSGDDVACLYWSKGGDWVQVPADLEAADFADGAPRGATPVRLVVGPGGGFSASRSLGRDRPLEVDAAIVCCHGGPGEDGTLQAVLDLAGVAYSGPSVASAALGMDKLAFGDVVSAAGLPTLPRVALDADGDIPFDGPYIVKPRFGGSSIGIDVVEDAETARARLNANLHLRAGAVIEPYRADLTDLQIGIRSWPELSVSAIERPERTGSAGFYSYADKYSGGEGMASAPRELPAKIDPSTADELRRLARRVGQLCGVRGVARLDFLWREGELYVNEINTVPGSLARYLWIEPAVPFLQLLRDLVDEARRRPTARYSTEGADGRALRSAGSIAGKLG